GSRMGPSVRAGPTGRPTWMGGSARWNPSIRTEASTGLEIGSRTKHDVIRHRSQLTSVHLDLGGQVIRNDSSGGIRHRWMFLAAAFFVTFGAGVALATPVAAQPAVGYVRLAHLSPDTPEVDVYLSKPGDASFKTQVFKGVGYGVISPYLSIPVGDYL